LLDWLDFQRIFGSKVIGDSYTGEEVGGVVRILGEVFRRLFWTGTEEVVLVHSDGVVQKCSVSEKPPEGKGRSFKSGPPMRQVVLC